jgi:hypothetical protein
VPLALIRERSSFASRLRNATNHTDAETASGASHGLPWLPVITLGAVQAMRAVRLLGLLARWADGLGRRAQARCGACLGERVLGEIDEAELISAGQSGVVVGGATGGMKRAVPAGLLRRCCHEFKDRIDPRGLRLTPVVIHQR